jgi:hypothetical protein
MPEAFGSSKASKKIKTKSSPFFSEFIAEGW